MGAGAVFLNSNFERYILADINPDLINLFNIVKENVEGYIEACKPIFFADDVNSMPLRILSNVRLFFYI